MWLEKLLPLLLSYSKVRMGREMFVVVVVVVDDDACSFLLTLPDHSASQIGRQNKKSWMKPKKLTYNPRWFSYAGKVGAGNNMGGPLMWVKWVQGWWLLSGREGTLLIEVWR